MLCSFSLAFHQFSSVGRFLGNFDLHYDCYVWFSVRFKLFSPVSSATAPLCSDLILSKCILSIISLLERLTYTLGYWFSIPSVCFFGSIVLQGIFWVHFLPLFFFFCSHQHKFAFYAGLPSLLNSLHHIGDHFNMCTHSCLCLNSLFSSSVLLVFLTLCSHAPF